MRRAFSSFQFSSFFSILFCCISTKKKKIDFFLTSWILVTFFLSEKGALENTPSLQKTNWRLYARWVLPPPYVPSETKKNRIVSLILVSTLIQTKFSKITALFSQEVIFFVPQQHEYFKKKKSKTNNVTTLILKSSTKG